MSHQSIETPKNMVIAFDAKRLFNNFTGLGNYSRTLVKNLQRYYPEHEYHLYTPGLKVNEENEYFTDKTKFILHTPKRYNPLWRTAGVSAEINGLSPDIFHGLSHELPFGLNKNILKLVSFHDLIYEKYPKQFGWWDRHAYHWKYSSAAKRADCIISISENTKADIVEHYGISEDKIQVIYQSCNQAFQDEDGGAFRILPQLAGLTEYYLYVGSIVERKGLLQTIIAYSGLPESYRKPFVVIGKGDKSYTTKVTDMIRYYGLEEYFYFVNSISNADLLDVYDRSFCLVYPSIYEGFGIPVIESLFRQKPVITSDLSSLPEAAGPGAILVNPYSPEDITAAMCHLHDKKLYDEISRKGAAYVRNRFSGAKTAASLMECYSNLIEK